MNYEITQKPISIDPDPIFIVGAPRSGTTLTASILNRHPEIYSPGETHFFEDTWAFRKTLGGLDNQESIIRGVQHFTSVFGRFNREDMQTYVDSILDKDMLGNQILASGEGYKTLYFSFMSALSKEAGKNLFCDDTPKHLYYLSTIFEMFPGAKVICCIRDPRDFLCSYKNYWRRSTESFRARTLYHPVNTSLLWQSFAKLILKAKQKWGDRQILIVRYEDLVNSPPIEINRMCHFLNVEFLETLEMVDNNNSSFSSSSTTNGIFVSSLGRWKECLNKSESWWNQRINTNEMSQFGYTLDDIRAPKAKLIITLLSSPLFLIRTLFVNRNRRGPLFGYIVRRLKALFNL